MMKIGFGAEGTVVIEGRLDAAQAATAQAFLDGVTGSMVLDCTALEYLSSAGLGVLLKTQKRLKAASGALRLTGVNRHVHDIFRYAGFDQIFEITAAP
jgi:anti-sigma B factor antagonist